MEKGMLQSRSQQILIKTKLTCPPVDSKWIQRPRLIARLNESLGKRVILVSAPAGYGKSTAASRWVGACNARSVWVSLDDGDSDLRTFLAYVLAATRSMFPKIRLETEALLEASPLPPAPVLARHLLNDLHKITEPFILVLDDYHHIRGETHVHNLLTEVLTYPPQLKHLVLLTRRDPPLPVSRPRGPGQLSEVRASDLRFTPDEALKDISIL